MVPLCPACHARFHDRGPSAFPGVDLRMEADRLWLAWRAFVRGVQGPPI